MIYSLYVKQHNQTFLKYLGHTTRNPYKYKGSGIRWQNHLKKHGNNVDTYIIGTYDTKKTLQEAGLYYSKVWNVVESNEWANLCWENGESNKGYKHTQKTKRKMSELAKTRTGEKNPFFGKKHTKEVRQQISDLAKTRTGEKNPFFGQRHTYKTRQKMRQNHVDVSGEKNPMWGKKRPDLTKRNLENNPMKKKG